MTGASAGWSCCAGPSTWRPHSAPPSCPMRLGAERAGAGSRQRVDAADGRHRARAGTRSSAWGVDDRARARGRDARRAPRRLRDARAAPGRSARPGAHARSRPLRRRRAGACRGAASAAARAGSCTCTSRTCAAAARGPADAGRRRLDLPLCAARARGGRRRAAWSRSSCRGTCTSRPTPCRGRSPVCATPSAKGRGDLGRVRALDDVGLVGRGGVTSPWSESLNSRIPWPSDRPAAGGASGPRITSAITRTMIELQSDRCWACAPPVKGRGVGVRVRISKMSHARGRSRRRSATAAPGAGAAGRRAIGLRTCGGRHVGRQRRGRPRGDPPHCRMAAPAEAVTGRHP